MEGIVAPVVTIKYIVDNWTRIQPHWLVAKRNMIKHKEKLYRESLTEVNVRLERKVSEAQEFVKNVNKLNVLSGGKTNIITETNVWDLISTRFSDVLTMETEKARYATLISICKTSKKQLEDEKTVNEQAFKLVSSLLDLESHSGDNVAKKIMAEIVMTFIFNWRALSESYLNFLIMGPPGTGKTLLASKIGVILGRSGILLTETMTVTDRASFVGEHLGETAPRTLSVLNNNLECVLFIDEAYQLAIRDTYSGKTDTTRFDPYSVECTGTIVGFSDKRKGLIAIVAAGYEREMKIDFLGINPGMTRRFPYRIVFRKYTDEQLISIFADKLGSQNNVDPSSLSKEAYDVLRVMIAYTHYDPMTNETIPQYYVPYQGGSMEIIADKVAQYMISRGLNMKPGSFGKCSMQAVLNDYIRSDFKDQSGYRLLQDTCAIEFLNYPNPVTILANERITEESNVKPKRTKISKTKK